MRYTVPADVAGGLSDATLIAKYVEAAQSATAYHLERRASNGEAVGVRAAALPGGIDVAYVHQYSATLFNNLIGRFSVAVVRQGGDVSIEVSCPTSARVETAGITGTGTYSPFIDQAKAVADLRTVCDRATLVFERRESGEVDVPYNDTSVHANFRRKLSSSQGVRLDAKLGDPSKFVWYSLQDGTKTMVVGVQVFPYRNGSKVMYVWPNNVVCRPNGRCNFDPTAARRVNDVIASVAND